MPLLFTLLAPLLLLFQQPGTIQYQADHIYMETVSSESGKTNATGPFGTGVTLTFDTVARTWLVVFTGQDKKNLRFSWHENAARTGLYFLDSGDFPWRITISGTREKTWKAECEQANENGQRTVFIVRHLKPAH